MEKRDLRRPIVTQSDVSRFWRECSDVSAEVALESRVYLADVGRYCAWHERVHVFSNNDRADKWQSPLPLPMHSVEILAVLC